MSEADGLRWTADDQDVEHSKENILTDREYHLLLEGARRIPDDDRGLEARFALLAAGRLGMRAGEITHLRDAWLDWRRRLIRIPAHDPCRKGRDGSLCGYCRQQVQQRLEGADVDEAAIANLYWEPKTEAGIREIPFDFDASIDICVELFFSRYDGWPVSRSTLRRRVDEALEHAPGLETASTNLHGLRATAATFHASRGVDAFTLRALMGWETVDRAREYIRLSGETTARALTKAHSW